MSNFAVAFALPKLMEPSSDHFAVTSLAELLIARSALFDVRVSESARDYIIHSLRSQKLPFLDEVVPGLTAAKRQAPFSRPLP